MLDTKGCRGQLMNIAQRLLSIDSPSGFTDQVVREAEQIARRLSPYGRQKRPRLRGLDDAELVEFMSRDMAAREPFYAQAQLIVDCGELSDDEVVETILRHTMQNE